MVGEIAKPALDAVCIGRLGIDLYPEKVAVSLANQRSFSRSLGGSPTNVSVGLARLGWRVGLVSGIGDDGFGDYAIAALEAYGVDTEQVRRCPGLRTPLVFAEVFPPDHFPLLFYRSRPAPDELISEAELNNDAIARARLLWVTGGSLSIDPARSAVLAALSLQRRENTIIDLDWRPSNWEGIPAPASRYREALILAGIVIGNEEEFQIATGCSGIEAAVAAVEQLGVDMVVVKRGPRGVSARSRGDDWVHLKAVPVQVRCGLGAGDAFGAAFMHGRLSKWELPQTLSFANVAGAIVAGRLHCAEAMPTVAEVVAGLDSGAVSSNQSSMHQQP